ncbi:MAG TPA: hypothetical protein VFP59_05245 [Candidatus Angelobacter sp.]|nr:hypothetical protein [Candidatus Angelobacter sp.]
MVVVKFARLQQGLYVRVFASQRELVALRGASQGHLFQPKIVLKSG